MLLDFNHMPEESFPHFKNGDGSLENVLRRYEPHSAWPPNARFFDRPAQA